MTPEPWPDLGRWMVGEIDENPLSTGDTMSQTALDLRVTYAGLFTHPFPREWEGKAACVLLGDDAESHAGVTIGVPCTLVEDPGSPLYFCEIGDLHPESAAGMRKSAKRNRVSVVLVGEREAIIGVRDLFMRRVRIVYGEAR